MVYIKTVKYAWNKWSYGNKEEIERKISRFFNKTIYLHWIFQLDS